MPPNNRTRYYPAVGPAIPRRWTSFSRVTHPSATELESCPPSPVRLTCVRHAASVRPEPGSNSPMIGKFEQLTERLWYFCRPNHNQNETPRGALLTTHPLKWGRTPHTRSSILKELLAKKSPQRDADTTRTSGMSQGGQLLEDTRRRRRHGGTQIHHRCRGLIPTTPHGIRLFEQALGRVVIARRGRSAGGGIARVSLSLTASPTSLKLRLNS